MSQAPYKMINPLVKILLRSPAHGLLSKNTLLLEFTGRKTGRTLSTPVSYAERDGRLHCFTNRNYRWWRNLSDDTGVEIELRLRGKRQRGIATVVADQPEVIASALTDFLMAVPRDAAHAGVRMDEHQRPISADIEAAAKQLIYINIELPNAQ